MTNRVVFVAKAWVCFGVRRAVDIVEDVINNKLSDNVKNTEVYVYHEIVHNKIVVERLKARGVKFITDLDEIQTDENTESAILIFSAHGVSPQIRTQAKNKQVEVIDATCPLVDKVHKQVVKFNDLGYQIIYIGHSHHDEVVGVLGEVDNSIWLVQSKVDIDNLLIDSDFDINKPTIWLSQTTLSVNETEDIIEYLHNKIPSISDPKSDCICLATTDRQNATLELVKEIGNGGLIIVVGSKNSSNTLRLTDLARNNELHNTKLEVMQIDEPSELQIDFIKRFQRIGITSGASVPEDITDKIINICKSIEI